MRAGRIAEDKNVVNTPQDSIVMKKQLTKSDMISEYTDKEVIDELMTKTDIAAQPEFYKMPYKFKSIPVDELPRGCDKDKQYYKIYPRATLPFQRAARIKFGHGDSPPNRLIWGDNLHVMRMLKSELIDVVYIDPPFFSGRNYNVIFGDRNEVRSFSDIWEGGMHSYLIWLNARLLEIKRLLKPTGSLFVHLDHHASHYVKIELDKIFGYENFVNEIVWYYPGGLKKISKHFPRKHDVILFYKKTNDKNRVFNPQRKEVTTDVEFWRRWGKRSSDGKNIRLKDIPVTDKINRERQIKKFRNKNGRMPKPDDIIYTLEGQLVESVWDDCSSVYRKSENIGYPTQKPESLLERIICSTTNEGDVVADFFVGGGGTPTVAQRLNRRWIACDQSRVAIAITQSRLESQHEKYAKALTQHTLQTTPDISVEYWGSYEIPTLEKLSEMEFKKFVVQAFGGKITSGDGVIHGVKNSVPLFVGSSKQKNYVSKADVLKFAQEIKEKRGKNAGTMIAWSFTKSAKIAVEKLKIESMPDIDLIQISLVELTSTEFKDHIVKLHEDYSTLLKFILPPDIVVKHERVEYMTYKFDASESMALNIDENVDAKIISVQWDFEYNGRFIPEEKFMYGKQENGNVCPLFVVKYKFQRTGPVKIACRVQDNFGGEKLHVEEIVIK